MELRFTILIMLITSLIVIQGFITYTNLHEYYTINGSKFLAELLNSPLSTPNITKSTAWTQQLYMHALNALDPYAEIFYYSKEVLNPKPSTQQIQKTHSMWWNYDRFPTKPFTKCEDKYLGYESPQTGDTSFNNSNRFKVLCKNSDYKNDIYHSHIECYDTKFKSSSYICSFKNIYAYIDGNNLLKFKAFCKHPIDKSAAQTFNRIKESYKNKGGNHRYPLYIDIIHENTSINSTFIEDAKYLETNNIWFYDNDYQCESHKKGDKEHMGNPWHCLAHLEYWYRISKAKHLSLDKHNITLVMSQFTDYTFGSNVSIYHLYASFFSNIINKDTINRTIVKHGSLEQNKLYYIKELYIDERASRGWGGSIIWAPKPEKTFFKDNVCKSTQELEPRRSRVLYDMRKHMMNYYELSYSYEAYDWIHELQAIDGVNKWEIDGDLNMVVNETLPLVVIATRYVNGRCRYRCVKNLRQVRDAVLDLLGDKYVYVYGNPGTLSFHAQYHLFKNTGIFIGVHGAVFSIGSLFMPLDNLKFEICLAAGTAKYPDSEIVVRALSGANVSYARYVCKQCNVKPTTKPSNVSVTAVIDAFERAVFKQSNLYNISTVTVQWQNKTIVV